MTRNEKHSFSNGAFLPSQTDLSRMTQSRPEEQNHDDDCYDLNQNQICTISGPELMNDYEIKRREKDTEKGSGGAGGSNDGIYEVQSTFMVLKQMLIPFTVAGIGSVFAGIVLSKVLLKPVFTNIPQFEIMVPAFLGLIGNIETTLASRLSTQANLGRLDSWSGLKEIMTGNILVVQCQSSALGLFAALASITISLIKEETRKAVNFDNIVILAVSSVVTSIIANTLLMATISLVIITARFFRVNPGKLWLKF